jgi:hypothetical protein
VNARTLFVASLLAGCAAQHAESGSAVNAPAKSADTASNPGEVLPFIDDDYEGAVAQAKAKGLPLFVDVWAPW